VPLPLLRIRLLNRFLDSQRRKEPQAASALSCDLRVMWAALTASHPLLLANTHSCVNFNRLGWLVCMRGLISDMTFNECAK